MSLNASGVASDIRKEHSSFTSNAPDKLNRVFIDILQEKIDKGFQDAKPSTGNFDISPPKGSLYFPNNRGYTIAEEIGMACASYWAIAIKPGSPEGCKSGQVVGVINDAAKIATPISMGIRALFKGELDEPFFDKFVKIIFDAVKTILWTITETDFDKCSIVLPGNVS